MWCAPAGVSARAGFAEPVMDTERLTVTYSGLAALVDELRGSGARNIAQGRPHGLTGRARAQLVRTRSEERPAEHQR